jgi:peroxiredoxin Q/BCP
MLAVGDDAPDFSLPDQHGDMVTLSEFDGRVVLYFYPRADTPGCTTEACGFRDAWEAFKERDIAVLGVSDDPVELLATFAEKHDLPVTLLSDADGEVSRAYDSYGEKNMFDNTFEGVFRNTYVLEDGEVIRVYEGVDPEGHATEILEDLS